MTAPRTDTTLPPNPTPAPLTPPIDPSGNVDTTTTENPQQLFMSALREKETENQRLRSLLEQRNAAPPVAEVDQWETFTGAPRDLIAQEVDRAVAPLNSFIQRMERDAELTKFKKIFRVNPMYAKVLDHAEHYVDQVLSGVNQLSVQAVELALTSVAGAIATGQIKIEGFNFGTTPPNPTPTPAPVPPRNPTVPPHIPPSSTPLPENTNAVPGKRELTETERRLARQWNMTDEEYLAGLVGEAVKVRTPTGATK